MNDVREMTSNTRRHKQHSDGILLRRDKDRILRHTHSLPLIKTIIDKPVDDIGYNLTAPNKCRRRRKSKRSTSSFFLPPIREPAKTSFDKAVEKCDKFPSLTSRRCQSFRFDVVDESEEIFSVVSDKCVGHLERQPPNQTHIQLSVRASSEFEKVLKEFCNI